MGPPPPAPEEGSAPRQGVVSPLAPHVATPAELGERLQAARSGDPFLVLRSAEDRQVLISLKGRSHITIGRRRECDLSVPWDARVSRLHAELLRIGGEWVVTDDGLSSNGTWIDGHRLAGRQRLNDGSLVRVGSTLIAFCAPAEPSASTLLTDSSSGIVVVSPAQRRVLVALCRPYLINGTLSPPGNAVLADELFLSVDSIKTHLRALFDAFDLGEATTRQKRAALVERAVRLGIVSSRDVTGD
jgi:pSer/pThr/pTyr-binding forkhead associated (FHA) protein